MRLEGKTIVVTGASTGLGRAMAEAFVEEGAAVVCAARTESMLEATAEEIAADRPGETLAVPTDVRSWEQVSGLVEATIATYDGLDVLVNNAGVTQLNLNREPRYEPVWEVLNANWDGIVDTNLRGVFLCTKAALGEMLPRDRGRIIHVSSSHGVEGRPNRSPYVASKWAVEGFHATLARELDGTGIESVTLRPPGGGVRTENKVTFGRDPDSFRHADPAVMAEPAVQLAAGAGSNGDRYEATGDGTGLEEYSH